MIWSVLMVGGAGTRLWPRSRRALPKQFMRIGGRESLITQAWRRGSGLAGAERTLVVATSNLAEPVRRELPELRPENLLAEPEGRDTAACVGLAATVIRNRDPEAVMAAMPADHFIEPLEGFLAAARTGCEVAARLGSVVTIGIVPAGPATAYGYVRRGEALEGGGAFEVPVYRSLGFREKPDPELAESYVASGEYYWNSGIFVWKADVIVDEIRKNLPAHAEALGEIAAAVGRPGFDEVLGRVYPGMPRISIDYGVLEKAPDVAIVEAGFNWDDIGSWGALAKYLKQDEGGNRVEGEFVGVDAEECIVLGPEGKLVAAVGVDDLVIVDTPDALLVCRRGRDQDVKKLVERLRGLGREDLL